MKRTTAKIVGEGHQRIELAVLSGTLIRRRTARSAIIASWRKSSSACVSSIPAKKRKEQALEYKDYLKKIIDLSGKVSHPETGSTYPESLDSTPKRALYDNLGKNEELALKIDNAVEITRRDNWRGNHFKEKEIKKVIENSVEQNNKTDGLQVAENHASYNLDNDVNRIFEIVKNQREYE